MRILHLLPPAAGGMLRHVQCLIEGLPEYAHYAAVAPGPGFEALARQLPDRCLPLPLQDGAGPGGLLRAGFAAARFARRLRPDLIHGHGYRGMLVAGVASRLCGRPFVFTAHTLPEELGRRFWRLAAPLCSGARGAACVSAAIATGLTERLPGTTTPRSSLRLRVVYNGIDPGPAPGPRMPLPESLACSGHRPVLLTAARLAPQKGIVHLLDAWASLAPTLPDGILLVAGDGPLRPELEARAAALGIGHAVHFLGFRDDVRRLIASADAVAIPSLAEGQSIFALEAMAGGAPVAATRAGGLAEMVRDGETGLLVPPGDAGALAEALRRILTEPATAERCARAARAWVETEMTVERMLARMDAFYKECTP